MSLDKQKKGTLILAGRYGMVFNRRMGRDKEAVMWYNKIVNDKSIRDAGIIRKAR